MQIVSVADTNNVNCNNCNKGRSLPNKLQSLSVVICLRCLKKSGLSNNILKFVKKTLKVDISRKLIKNHDFNGEFYFCWTLQLRRT